MQDKNLLQDEIIEENHHKAQSSDPLDDRIQELPVMDENSINRAILMHEDNHKLQKTPITEVFGFLKLFQYVLCCMCCRPKRQPLDVNINEIQKEEVYTNQAINADEEDGLQYKKEDDDQETDEQINELEKSGGDSRIYSFRARSSRRFQHSKDPFMIYGLGTKAYFHMQTSLIKIMCFMITIALPVIAIFGADAGLTTVSADGEVNSFVAYSFGNIGFASPDCSRSPVLANDTTLVIFQCQNPTQVTQIVDVGLVYAADISQQGLCYTSESFSTSSVLMMDWNQTKANEDLLSSCSGQTQCETYLTPQDYYISQPAASLYDESNTVIMYAQAICQYTDEDLQQQRQKSLVIVCIGIFMCLVYTFTINYLQSQFIVKSIIWDSQCITLSDFSTQWQINPQTYRSYITQANGLGRNDKANIIGFKEALVDHVERELKKNFDSYQAEILDSTDIQNIEFDTKIVSVKFAFDNKKMIQLLEKRARFLEQGKFAEANQVERDLTELMKAKRDQLQTPVCAFITFEQQKVATFASYKPLQQHFYHQIVDLANVKEPTDVIWENKAVTKTRGIIFKVLALIVTLSLSVVAFSLIINSLQIYNGIQEFISPTDVNCQVIEQQYQPESMFQKLAFINWQTSVQNYDFFSFYTDGSQNFNTLSCFCLQQQENGASFEQVYESTIAGQQEQASICEEWGKFSSGPGNFALQVFRVAVTSICTSIINGIYAAISSHAGFHTQSDRLEFIKNGMFFVQFFNIAVLIPLAGFNAKSNSAFIESAFQGNYREINNLWIGDVGFLFTLTLFVTTTLQPLIQSCCRGCCRKCKKAKDQKRCCCQKNNYHMTQQKTVWSFLKFYNGPDVKLEIIYSSMMTIVLVAMFYGSLMPLLFLIGLIQVIALYLLERYSLAYVYKQPPMYDNQLTRNCFWILKIAPILYCLSGTWVFTNQQAFQNIVVPIDYTNQIELAHHFPDQLVTQINPGTPLIFMFFIFVFEYIFRVCKATAFKKQQRVIFLKQKMLERNYWDSILPTQKNQLLMEELSYQLRLGVRTITDDTLKKLGASSLEEQTGINHMVTQPSYDLLAAPSYQERLLYTNGTVPVAIEQIVSEYQRPEVRRYTCDVVLMASQYAYFGDQVINGCDLSVPSLYENRPANSHARYDEIYTMLNDYKTSCLLLDDSKSVLFAENDQDKQVKN